MSAAQAPVDPAQRVLDENVARLRRRCPELARAVLEAGAEGVELVEGPRGQRSVSIRGMLLASAYDPVREGQRLAASMDDQPVDLLVAVGFGLGHHLEAFRERNPSPILIYEPSAERLRAALSARPALRLLEREDVVITDDPRQLREEILRRYTPGLRMRVFPHPVLLALDPDAVRQVVDLAGRLKDSLDILGNTRSLKMEEWARITAANVPYLLRSASIGPLLGSLRGSPAVVCAAGPSLTRQLPRIRANRQRLFVIAIGQSLAALREAGIEPDLVHIVEDQDVSHQVERAGGMGEVPLVLPPQAARTLFEMPVRYRLVAYQSTNPFGCWIGQALGERRWVRSGGTVAQCAVYLAAALGASPILLVGQDLAFTEGRVYARGTAYDYVGYEAQEDGRFRLTGMERKLAAFGQSGSQREFGGRLLQVEGWDGRPVWTNEVLATFRDHYQDLARELALDGVQVVNCTEGGARIPGLEHRSLAQALEELPAGPVDGACRLRSLAEEALPASGQVFEAPLQRARRTLDRMERDARAGLAALGRAQASLPRATPQRQVELLRKLARAERKLNQGAAAVPFMEALVQPELHALGAMTRRADAAVPTPEQALAEGRLLLTATLAAIPKARKLLLQIEQSSFERS